MDESLLYAIGHSERVFDIRNTMDPAERKRKINNYAEDLKLYFSNNERIIRFANILQEEDVL